MLKLENVTLYKQNYMSDNCVLKNIYADFSEKVNIIYGPPGAGKSTLFDTIAGLEKPSGGSILSEHKYNLEYITQVPERQFIFSTCREELGPGGEVEKVLEKVGLEDDILSLSPWILSNGEKKRLLAAGLILRGMIFRQDSILLIDDPFNSMDEKGVQIIFSELIEPCAGISILAINNSMDMKRIRKKYSDSAMKIYRLENGLIL